MLRALVPIIAMLVFAPAGQPGEAQPLEQFRVWVDLEIDATGQVTSATPVRKIDPELASAVIEAAEQWIFAPMADNNGVPAPSTSSTWLELTLFEGAAGLLDLQINRLYEGPRPVAVPQPTLRGGVERVETVLPAQFVVDENGRPRDITLLESGPEDAYALAAIGAVRRTRFIPRTAAGEPVAVWVVFPIEFSGPGLDEVGKEPR